MKYDPATRELHVKYGDGGEKAYAYSGVSETEAENIFHSSSPGSSMRKQMIGLKSFRKIDG
jgi:hypothetical protein